MTTSSSLVAALLLLFAGQALAQQGWRIDASSKEEAKDKTPHPARRLQEGTQTDVETYRAWFADWKAYFNKTYVSQAEEDQAFTNFQASMDRIRSINFDDSKPYWASGNIFADKNLTQLTEKYRQGMPVSSDQHRRAMMAQRSRRSLQGAAGITPALRKLQQASSVDWRTTGKLTAIKSEGSCGSCWGFAGVEAIESAYLIGTGQNMSSLPGFELSVQQVIDCENAANGPYMAQGCNGGASDETWLYCANAGLSLASAYSGCASAYTYGTSVQLSGQGGYVQTYSMTALMEAVARQPIVFYYSVDVTVPDFWFYQGGLFTTNCAAQVNHAMVMVGYQYTGDLSTSYWIARNAYGATWGDAGYMLLPMYPDGSNGVSNSYTWLAYPPLTWARTLA